MGQKVPGKNTAGGAECEQQGPQEHALYPEGNGEPWKAVGQGVTRS